MSPNTIINKKKTLSYKQLHIIKYAFQKCKTNDIIFDVYRFSNMILANEHRSLGPIFVA